MALLVVVQAAVMVLAVAGFFHWIDDGNSADSALLKGEDLPDFSGSVGFMIHGLSGTLIIPIVAILLLLSSFFAKVPRGVVLALVVFVSTAVQVFAGIGAHDSPYIGLVHGLNAFILFGAAVMAARSAAEAGSTQAAPTQVA
jgi:hypothetical protein